MTNAEYDVPQQPPPNRPTLQFQRPKIGPFWWTVIALVVLGALLVAFADVWTEVLWFNQVGFSDVFWTSWFARIGLFILGALIVGGIVGLNLFLAFRMRKAYSPLAAADRNLEQYRRQIQPYRRWIFWGITILLGAMFGSALSAGWQTVLLFFNQFSFGTTDPQFNLDVSFYVFSLPFLRIVTSVLMTALGLSLV
nr:COG1615 family transporter [Actinomycetales bacterium]